MRHLSSLIVVLALVPTPARAQTAELDLAIRGGRVIDLIEGARSTESSSIS